MKLFTYCVIFTTVFFALPTAQGQNVEDYLKKEGRQKFFQGFTTGDPFKVTGGLGVNLRTYTADGIDNRQPPFSWYLSGQLNVRIYKLNIPISALLSAQNLTYSLPFSKSALNSFTNRYSRYGASPYYKWVKLHFGYRAMTFSPLTVANHTFLGAGMELTPGLMRFGFFYGKMARTEPVDVSLVRPTVVAYNRKGWGAKIGYGTNDKFIDFIVFKAKDAPNTTPINQDSARVFQQENLVVGLNGQTTLFKRVRVSLELVSSGLTKNAEDPTVANSRFLQPDFLLQRRTSTKYRFAANSEVQYRAEFFSVGMAYRRIEPDFRTLGAYYFNDDLENISGNAGFDLFKKRLRIKGSAGVQHNNLRGSKASQFSRTIGSLDVDYNLQEFNFGLNYSNYSSRIDYVLNLDLTKLNAIIVTSQTGLNCSYNHMTKNKGRHSVNASLSFEQVTDNVADPVASSASKMISGVVNYNYSTAEDRWKFNSRLDYNQNELSHILINRYGVGAGVQREILPKKWSLGFDLAYYNAHGTNLGNETVTMRLNSPLRLTKTQRLDLSLMFLDRFHSTPVVSTPNFREFTGMINYSLIF